MTAIWKSPEGQAAVQERYRTFLNYWPLPSEQLSLPTREGETFVVASGPLGAPALLLFHGSGANSAMWMGDVKAWAEHFRVYSVDMIGEPGLSAPRRPALASEAHALWLDDVLQGLGLERVSLVGISLGGWLALDYATRHPGRIASLVLLCPGGVGRQRSGFSFKARILLRLGPWGRNRAKVMALGKAPAGAALAPSPFTAFLELIFANFLPRHDKLPIFADEALRRLTMPVMLIAGVQDALLDSAETKRRLAATLPYLTVRFLPEAGHLVIGQTQPILEFLAAAHAGDLTSAPISSIGRAQPP